MLSRTIRHRACTGRCRAYVIAARSTPALGRPSNHGLGTLVYATNMRTFDAKDVRAIQSLTKQAVGRTMVKHQSMIGELSDYYMFEIDKNPVAR